MKHQHIGDFEQLIMLAVIHLDENAYGVTIRREIEARTGRDVSSGAVYTALERLTRRGYVASTEGEPTPVRGGRRKRFYRVEPTGLAALDRSRSAISQMAAGLPARLKA